MSDTFILNGKETPYTPGQMILEAAKVGGIEIPTLCYLKGSTPTGACRICLVEVKARITEKSAPGSIFMNFHFTEAPVNFLTNPALDPTGKIPEYKVCAVKLEAA